MNSDKSTARLLGFMFVFVVIAGVLSSLPLGSFGYTLLGAPENISKTMLAIADNPTAMQLGIIGYLIESVAIVLLATLLYIVLKTQNKIIALWALGLWIAEAAFVAIRQISAFSLLNVSQEFSKATDSSYLLTLGTLFFRSMQFILASQMVFYTIGGLLFYYLFFKSKYIPTWLALFGIAVASLGFIGELFVLLDYDVSLFVFLPILPFELAIGIWLMIKGIGADSEPSAQPGR